MGNQSFRTLSIDDFVEMTSRPDFSKVIEKEHNKVLAVQLPGTCVNFSRPQNSLKNRYDDIPCWDHSRVILIPPSAKYNYNHTDPSQITLTPTEIPSTYIHANFVSGFKERKKFICCQAPKKNTVENFWRMVLEQDSHIIVSLTKTDKGGFVCSEYWINAENGIDIFGRYVIRTLEIVKESSFTRTRLRLTDMFTDTSREIHHLWYTDWPNVGNPINPVQILDLIMQMNKKREELTTAAGSKLGPIVVHCAEGVGRTGIFCTIDNALSQLRKEQTVCLPQTVLKLRKQRHSSVFLIGQYAFCYKVVRYALITDLIEKILY
ncbi:tyrosine-protein phosphatase non-receptor type 9-like [Microplitis mediator]|uniref:tyrosine-protein phosphatase non-receptor type 9-like n=1 Tax=Microplitis mediator TaxID=375433 RepID=UPI0025569489|nr:tyrosine-protein phosphatase non-receptor type 9-like [Microplitis mediator]